MKTLLAVIGSGPLLSGTAVGVAGRAIRYTGPVGEARPDAVHGGPELTCR